MLPTKEHWFAFNDCCVHVSEAGPVGLAEESPAIRDVLLFLHGRFGDAESWIPLIRILSERFRCYSLDLPGFGSSFSVMDRALSLIEQAELVEHVCRRLAAMGRRGSEQARVVVVGHDVGAAVAQICLLSASGASAAILVNAASVTHPLQTRVGARGAAFGPSGRKVLSRALEASRLSVTSRLLLEKAWVARQDRALFLRAIRGLEESWPGTFESRQWRKRLAEAPFPSLYLWGREDLMEGPLVSEDLLRDIPESDSFQVECGHWPHLEEPDWVAGKIREFLFRALAERREEEISARRSLSR